MTEAEPYTTKILVFSSNGEVIYRAGPITSEEVSEMLDIASKISEDGVYRLRHGTREIIVKVSRDLRGVLWY
ncbi:MAG: hypothetical protein DRO13_05955 [Thermoprotei archaeon]|nr:MAG: hypothetical protein DRO13_05955 [Thermoprotei archaeon]